MASNLIINDFLTFVQNKADVLDELTIVQICVSSFSDEDIESVKNVLFENTDGVARNIQRKGEDKNKKNVKDVIKRLKETDPTLQPIFVAKDLSRLPPVTFDHIDVTRLLKDLSAMKCDLQDIRNEAASKLELTQLETKISSDISHVLACVKNSDQNESPKAGDSSTNRKRINLSPTANDVLSPSLVPQRNRTSSVETVFTPSYRDIVQRRPLRQTNSNLTQARRSGFNRAATNNSQAARVSNVLTVTPEDDFKLVVRKKPTKQRNMRGTLQNSDRILVSESKSAIYLSRANKNTTAEDVKNHIKDMGQKCVSVELLKQNRDVDFHSFKIVVFSSQISFFLDTNFWPKGLVFRRFRERNAPSVAATKNKLNG